MWPNRRRLKTGIAMGEVVPWVARGSRLLATFPSVPDLIPPVFLRGVATRKSGSPPVRGYSAFRGARRCCLVLARRSFISRILRFSAGGRGERRRRAFSFSAIRRLLASVARFSSNSVKRRTAMVRFWCCERESLTVTDNPVGICRKVTAVDTLLTF
jgi:hypothetical protein